MTQANERRDLTGKFLELLAVAAAARKERMDYVPGIDGTQELGWVVFEREAMWGLAQRERAARLLLPVTVEDVYRIEVTANGHIDYTQKFAFGCAELAMGLR